MKPGVKYVLAGATGVALGLAASGGMIVYAVRRALHGK